MEGRKIRLSPPFLPHPLFLAERQDRANQSPNYLGEVVGTKYEAMVRSIP